jgi:hypothetical protein
MNFLPKSAAVAVLLLAAASLTSCVWPDPLYYPPSFPTVAVATSGYYGDPYYADDSYYRTPYYGSAYYRAPYYGVSSYRAPYYGVSSYRPYYSPRYYGYNRGYNRCW